MKQLAFFMNLLVYLENLSHGCQTRSLMRITLFSPVKDLVMLLWAGGCISISSCSASRGSARVLE